jgi:hypothetical protein
VEPEGLAHRVRRRAAAALEQYNKV